MLLLQLLSKTESDSGSSTFTNSYQHCHKPLPETGSDPGSATVKKLLQEVWSDPGCATVTNPYYRLDLIQDVLLSQTPTRDWIWSRKFYCHKTFTRDWIWSRKCYCHKPLLETGSDPGCATVTKPLPETGFDPGSATVTNPYYRLVWWRKCYCHKPLLETGSDPRNATVTNPYQRLDLIQEVLLSQTPTTD